MKTAGGGVRVFVVSKNKTQSTGTQFPLHHPSECPGRQPPIRTERQSKDQVANVNVYQKNGQSCPFQNCQVQTSTD